QVISVEGCYHNLPPKHDIWVAVEDKQTGTFYLDAPKATKKGSKRAGTWRVENVPVGSFADEGKSFEIWAFLVEESSSDHQSIVDYQENKVSQGLESLPGTAPRSASKTVIRQTSSSKIITQ
ncbi:MAG: hypothetical protein AAB316_19780, partial [Bacteroidota bacterium]